MEKITIILLTVGETTKHGPKSEILYSRKNSSIWQEDRDVYLACKALLATEPPDWVVWRQNNINLYLSMMGRIANAVEKQG